MATTTRKRSNVSSRKETSKQQSSTSTAPLPANGNGSAPSNQETLRQLYLALLKCRLLEEHLQRHSPGKEYDFSIGHEAVVAGTTFGLQAQDTITASSRNLGALIAGGTPLNCLLSQRNTETICSYGLGSIIATASLPTDPFNLGTGLALAHKIEKKQNVVVALCSLESPTLDQWHEGLKSAGAHKLPILYVIKGVAADPSTSGEHHPQLEDFSFMARDYGFPGIIVDGDDLVAVWRVAQESLHRARNGAGPTLIDCRTESSRDPLAHMQHYMRKRNVWDDAWKEEISKQIGAEFETALSTPAWRA